MSANQPPMVVRRLGCVEYTASHRAMQQFTDTRNDATADELWLLEHPPVFTQGQAGRAEHLLDPGPIPVVQSDRGGQITYHGPGQIVGYVMVDLVRMGIGVRSLVRHIEAALVACIGHYGIQAAARADAPGVYLDDGAKIASLGLRVRRGRSFHGLALNVDMDLAPFSRINPCGMQGQRMAQLRDCGVAASAVEVRETLVRTLLQRFT